MHFILWPFKKQSVFLVKLHDDYIELPARSQVSYNGSSRECPEDHWLIDEIWEET